MTDRCLICDAQIVFARTTYGRRIVVDATPSDNGILVFAGQGRVRVIVPDQVPARSRHTSHDRTCLRMPL